MGSVEHLDRALVKLNACEEAVTWAKDQPSLEEAWLACEHPAWMLWLLHKTGADRKLMVELACDCAETALPIWLKRYPDDDRPANAIRTARAWARGTATRYEVREARSACWDAAAASYAASAYAAAAAAAYAAYAADAASAAFAAAARFKARREIADLIRKRVPAAPKVKP